MRSTVSTPDWQLCLEVDWSGCHAHTRKNALIASRMNVGPSGKQAVPHDSFIDPEHAALMLGPGEVKMTINEDG